MLTVNGVEPTSINYNGTELTEVYAKQGASGTPVLVWASSFTYNWTGDWDTIPGIDSYRTGNNRDSNYMNDRNQFMSSDTSDIGMVISRSFPTKLTTSFELDCHAVPYSQMGFEGAGLNPIIYPTGWSGAHFNNVSPSYPFSLYNPPAQSRIRLDPKYWTKFDGVLQTNYIIPFIENGTNLSLAMPRFEPGSTVYMENLSDGRGTTYTPDVNAPIVLDNVPATRTVQLVYTGTFTEEVEDDDGNDRYLYTILDCTFDIPAHSVYETSDSPYDGARFTEREPKVYLRAYKSGIENEISEGDVLGELTINLNAWASYVPQYIVWDRWRPIFTAGTTQYAGEWETGKPSYDTKTATVLN